MSTPIIGLGAGGHAKVVIEILRTRNEYEIVGLLDPKPELSGAKLLGIPILGNDDSLNQMKALGIHHFFIGLGSVGDSSRRQSLFELAMNHEMLTIDAIHPSAFVSESASLGKGLTMMAGAIINSSAVIGSNVIVNTGAIVEHDCVLEDHVHVASGACLAGSVLVGKGAHIGIGAVVREGLSIGQGAIVGAGAVVVNDIAPNTIVIGVPARFHRVTKPSP